MICLLILVDEDVEDLNVSDDETDDVDDNLNDNLHGSEIDNPDNQLSNLETENVEQVVRK